MKASHIQKCSLWTLAGAAWTVTILCSISAFAQDKVLIGPPRPAVREAVQMETAPGQVTDALREPVNAVLVVQNHAEAGAGMPMLALTDVLVARLSGHGLRIVNPYNTAGTDQNRTAAGEQMPEVSAMELARELRAPAAITASVVEFLDSSVGNPPLFHQYSVRMSMSLADSVTGAAVCGVNVLRESPKYTKGQVAANKLKYLGDLLNAAADECAAKLIENPAVRAWHPDRLPPPPSPGAGYPGLTVGDIDAAVQNLFGAMRANPVFRSNYDKAQGTLDRAPLAIIGGIVDMTGNKAPCPGIDDLLSAASQGVRMAFINSGLFEAKDDAVIAAITKRIVESGNSPLEDGELMAALKQHGSPDFYVAGDMMYFTEEDEGRYRLRLALHNLHDGKIVWEGVSTINKPAAN